MSTVVEYACAKINLALHIIGRRTDGYHALDSLVCFATIGDRLTLTPASEWSLSFSGPFAKSLGHSADNLVLQAALSLQRLLPQRIRPAALVLEKNLPVASGIGGGSADAAATLRGMMRLCNIDRDALDLASTALELGADVPVCLDGLACRMTGIGEGLAPLAEMPRLPALLVNPRVPVATGAVFSALGLAPGERGFEPLPDPVPDFLAWITACRNDLEPAALTLVPAIAEVLNSLRAQPGCRLARMSGSGATCFAIFSNQAAARAAAAALEPRGWWMAATTLGPAVASVEAIDTKGDSLGKRSFVR